MALTPTGRAHPLHVLGVGAIGGALSWVFAVTIGVPPVLSHWWLAVPAAMLLGAGAAYIGVYLLASSDTAQVHRCLAFALLCGVAWKPVWDAGTALVDQSIRRQQYRARAAELETRTHQVMRELTERPPQEASRAIAEASKVAEQLTDVASATEATDPELAARLQLQAAATVTAALTAEKRASAAEPGSAPPAFTMPLPIDATRVVLSRARERWAERDPDRAKEFDRALADLEGAVRDQD